MSRRFVRYIAVANFPDRPPCFCGHLHRSAGKAGICATKVASRFPGSQVEVASSHDCDVDPCPMVDYHRPRRLCPVCALEG